MGTQNAYPVLSSHDYQAAGCLNFEGLVNFICSFGPYLNSGATYPAGVGPRSPIPGMIPTGRSPCRTAVLTPGAVQVCTPAPRFNP